MLVPRIPRDITSRNTSTTHAIRMPVRTASHPRSWLTSAATNAATLIQLKVAPQRTTVIVGDQPEPLRAWLISP